MELKNQVCTIEQAKKLQELGIEADCLYYFLENFGIVPRMVYDGYGGWEEDETLNRALTGDTNNYAYPAYTVAELGVMLPDGADCKGKHWAQFNSFRVARGAAKENDRFHCYCDYSHPDIEAGDEVFRVAKSVHGETEAQARASMLIYLLENKLITPEQVNASLTKQ